MDIRQDLIIDIEEILSKFNVRLSKNADVLEALLDYLSFIRKYIPLKRRTVLLSSELKKKLPTHNKTTEAITIFEDTYLGNDLNPYQSDKLFQTRFHDRLLYNWGIHHLHLSLENEKKSYFKKRTNDLLFVHFKNNTAYFLDYDTHGYGNFANEKWLRILNNNWLWLLKKFKGDELFENTKKMSPKDRQLIWDKGFNLTLTNVDGQAFIDPGLGNTTSGHNLSDVMEADEILRTIYSIEEWYINNKDELSNEISKYYNIPINSLEFKGRIGKKGIEFFEKNSGYVIISGYLSKY